MPHTRPPSIIAIDGPSGTGKSTVARLLAKRLGYFYLDTGAMYRSIGLKVVRGKIPWENHSAIIKTARQAKIIFRFSRAGIQKIFLDGKDVTHALRRPEISEAASRVAVIPEVRKVMVSRQRAIGRRGRLVAEGRDIGTVVFPKAPLKIYLTASAAERARRRYEELKKAGHPLSYKEVLHQTRLRDRRDSRRAVSPLKPATDAVRIDNSRLRLSEVFDTIESYI